MTDAQKIANITRGTVIKHINGDGVYVVYGINTRAKVYHVADIYGNKYNVTFSVIRKYEILK